MTTPFSRTPQSEDNPCTEVFDGKAPKVRRTGSGPLPSASKVALSHRPPTTVGIPHRGAARCSYMARLPRLDPPNVHQHIVQRGNNRLPRFLHDEDRQRYLELLRETFSAAEANERSRNAPLHEQREQR